MLNGVRISIKELESWEIMKEDRDDYKDWLPHHVSYPGHQIRIYYINVNPLSSSYNNYAALVVNVVDGSYMLDEWNGISGIPVSRING
jgi:hypothetical protein